jgi:hypothetical protein
MILNVSLTPHLEELFDQAVTSRSHPLASKAIPTAVCLAEPATRQANLLQQHIHNGTNNSLASNIVSESRSTPALGCIIAPFKRDHRHWRAGVCPTHAPGIRKGSRTPPLGSDTPPHGPPHTPETHISLT